MKAKERLQALMAVCFVAAVVATVAGMWLLHPAAGLVTLGLFMLWLSWGAREAAIKEDRQ